MRSYFIKILLLFCILMAAPVSISSNGIGLGGTIWDTWGIVYRKNFENNLSIGATLGGGLNYSYGYLGTSFGLFYKIAEHNFNFAALPDASIRFNILNYFSCVYHYNNDGERFNSYDLELNRHTFKPGVGPGFGIEFNPIKFLSLHLESAWNTKLNISNKTRFDSSRPEVGGGFIFYF